MTANDCENWHRIDPSQGERDGHEDDETNVEDVFLPGELRRAIDDLHGPDQSHDEEEEGDCQVKHPLASL
jgi:hypothetical protein